MSEYHPEFELGVPVVNPLKSVEERFYPSWWDRLLGRACYMNKLNHRNAHIQHLDYINNTEIEVLRQAVNDLQPERVLKQEGKYLDEIGVLKSRIGELETEILLHKSAAEQRRMQFDQERAVRNGTLGRAGRGHVAPNSGAHSTSGQISSSQDGGSGILMQAAMLHTVLAADSAPSRSEPAYCTPESSRSESSYSHCDSGGSSDSGGGGGGD